MTFFSGILVPYVRALQLHTWDLYTTANLPPFDSSPLLLLIHSFCGRYTGYFTPHTTVHSRDVWPGLRLALHTTHTHAAPSTTTQHTRTLAPHKTTVLRDLLVYIYTTIVPVGRVGIKHLAYRGLRLVCQACAYACRLLLTAYDILTLACCPVYLPSLIVQTCLNIER